MRPPPWPLKLLPKLKAEPTLPRGPQGPFLLAISPGFAYLLGVMSAAVAAFTPVQQALLADLVLAGVAFDVQETPVTWLGVAVQPSAQTPIETPVVAKAAPVLSSSVAPAAPVEEAYQVWQAGEPGGVAVVLAAPGPLAAAETLLLQNMLKAVGLQAAPLAYVGLAGAPGKAKVAAAQAALTAAVAGFNPTHTLVLGQAVLGVLLGKMQGVEGWQAAPTTLGLPGQVGVTFPLDLLLNKPLFKGLAWQHLQTWRREEMMHG